MHAGVICVTRPGASRGQTLEAKVQEAFEEHAGHGYRDSSYGWALSLEEEVDLALGASEEAPALERSGIRIACHCMPNDLLPSFFLPQPNDHMMHSLRLWKRATSTTSAA